MAFEANGFATKRLYMRTSLLSNAFICKHLCCPTPLYANVFTAQRLYMRTSLLPNALYANIFAAQRLYMRTSLLPNALYANVSMPNAFTCERLTDSSISPLVIIPHLTELYKYDKIIIILSV